MLSLKNVSLSLFKGRQLEKKILENVTFSVNSGEMLILLGANGSGKSTLLKAIMGSLKHDSGVISIKGNDMSCSDRTNLISQVVQDPMSGTMPGMTVLENMAFAFKRGSFRGLKFHTSAGRVKFIKDRMACLSIRMDDKLDVLARDLSGGQRQLLSLAVAVLYKMPILLLDEITASLDHAAADRVVRVIRKLANEGMAVLMVTHDLKYALEYADRAVILSSGSIKREFTGGDLRNMDVFSLAKELC